VEETKAPREKLHRVSAIDYVASLARAPLYIADYEELRKREERLHGVSDWGMIGETAGKPADDLLARWPLLLKPIPPDEARKTPAAFTGHLVPPVAMATETPGSWDDWQTLANLPWPAARFHPVWINFFRTNEEIIEGLEKIRERIGNLPVRESVPKAKGMPDRWRIWDTYAGPGKSDLRKTAGILFRETFDDKAAEAEKRALARMEKADLMKKADEAERLREPYIRVGCKRCAPRNARDWHIQEYLKRKYRNMAAIPKRQGERKRKLAYLTRQVDICRQMIEDHKPVSLDRDSTIFRTLV
jgi:hypothetical protein